MGRKARYRKYKAVDPFCVGERKDLLKRHENAFNKAPKKEDFEQKAPKGFLELMETIEHSKAARSQPKKKKKNKSEGKSNESNAGTENKKKKFERHRWESDDQYLDRVDRIVTNIVHKEKMEILKSGGDQDAGAKKLTKEKQRKMKRIKKTAAAAKKKKIEEQEDYSKAMKNEMMMDQLEEDMLKDKVEFGEVAMAPPVLTKAPRKSQDKAKPGQRELLLKEMMSGTTKSKPGTDQTQRSKGPASKEKTSDPLNKVKKRKDMSASEKMRFDRTRNDVIEAYRKQRNTKRISLPIEENVSLP